MTRHTKRIHDAACDTWDLPRAGQGGDLRPRSGPDDVTDRYLAAIAPAYDRLSRVLAQLCGIFLLALTRDAQGNGLHLDHAMYGVARDQLNEARETLGGVPVPDPAHRHHAAMGQMAAHLSDAARDMDRMSALKTTPDRDIAKREILKRLAEAQHLLIATAEPDSGITPVDFTHACCNCTTGAA